MRESESSCPVEIGSRLELFVDKLLVDRMCGAELRLHKPQKMPRPESPFAGAYMTVLKDEDRYRGYYREYKPDYQGEKKDGNRGENTCYVESRDGIEWEKPDLGLCPGGRRNAILEESPFAHNFSPFKDPRPDIPENERYKALAGLRSSGLYAFASEDGIHWRRISSEPVLSYNAELHGRLAFDSQNLAFWSQVEQCYVAYFRHFKTPHGGLRSIGRATSKDFLNWTDQSETFEAPNLPGEQLYTSQTHPYFRAPHIYIALPTRFAHGRIKGDPVHGEDGGLKNVGSTDILFMTSRAGSGSYERVFKEALIRPGLDPEGWMNRSNYVALNVVPTGRGEMSIYHRNGHRYVLRTDGFASVNAPHEGGEFVTKPLIFDGGELVLNLSTSVGGEIRVELTTAGGDPLPGYTLEDCPPIIGDSIEHVVSWKDGSDVSRYAGQPVRLRMVMKDSDIYSLQFR